MKPYQMVGLNWLRILHDQKVNGILADEMVRIPITEFDLQFHHRLFYDGSPAHKFLALLTFGPGDIIYTCINNTS